MTQRDVTKQVFTPFKRLLVLASSLLLFHAAVIGQTPTPKFKVVGFFTAKNDQAHISFVHEANKWFSSIAGKYGFTYDSTNNWSNLNAAFLSRYDVVMFLDTRPEQPEQRDAFRKYMENGGGWIGFHFAGFALNNSDFPQNWDWYHDIFLGSGEYGSNTWRPTSAVLRVEDRTHPATRHLPETFSSAPNEWYRWKNDLRHKSRYQHPGFHRFNELSTWNGAETT